MSRKKPVERTSTEVSSNYKNVYDVNQSIDNKSVSDLNGDQPVDKQNKRNEELVSDALAGFARVLSLLVERFGWPGTLGILGLYYINNWMTPEQKKIFIDTYVMGIGIGSKIQLIVLSVFFVSVIVIQKKRYDKTLELNLKELDRVRLENDKLQTDIKKSKKELNQIKREQNRSRSVSGE